MIETCHEKEWKRNYQNRFGFETKMVDTSRKTKIKVARRVVNKDLETLGLGAYEWNMKNSNQ